MDAYLFMYFSEFLTLREFVLYTRTSKYYREKLIMDNIEKRLAKETYAVVSSYISDDTKIQMTSYTETNKKNTMTFSGRFSYLPLYNQPHYAQTVEYDFHNKDVCIEVPGWRFSWYGNIIISYGIEDLMQRGYVEVRVAQTPFAEIGVILSYDRPSRTICIDEIKISYIKHLDRWLWRHRVKRYAMSICLMGMIIAATYPNPGICVITSLIGLALSMYYTRKIHPSYFDIYPEVGETTFPPTTPFLICPLGLCKMISL
jgi:hypothetical protein